MCHEVHESVNYSVFQQSRIGDHLAVCYEKLLFFSIAILISQDTQETFHFAKQIHFKGVF